jgi:hypothetical protein
MEDNGVEDEPVFTDRDNWDYSILPSDPAFQQGVDVSEPYDFNHVPVVGGTPNIGVSENRTTPIYKTTIQ